MDPISEAMEAHRPADPVARLRRHVREAGRTPLNRVTQTVIRDRVSLGAAVRVLVDSGEVRVEVIPTGHHPRTDLVWVGEGG